MSQPVINNDAQTLIAWEDVGMAVRRAIADTLERPVEEVLPDSDLEKDLRLDSLAVIQASIRIEEQFHIPVLGWGTPEATFKTVNDLTALVASIRGAAASGKEEQKSCQ